MKSVIMLSVAFFLLLCCCRYAECRGNAKIIWSVGPLKILLVVLIVGEAKG
jgi:hypothetical protein